MLKHFFLIFFFIFISNAHTQIKETIKAGTLAPDGSDWAVIFEQMNAELINKSKEQIQFRFFFGRDEKELVDLLQNQQLDAALMSTAGLGSILPETFVFQLPMLFLSYEELDFVRDKLTDHYYKLFEKEGYVLLGWGDMGYI